MATPYLSETEIFPAILTVAAAARGQVAAIEGAHAGWGVTDYATCKFWPNTPAPAINPMAAKSLTQCADDLDAFHKANSGVQAHTIDWTKWLTLLQTIATALKGLGVG